MKKKEIRVSLEKLMHDSVIKTADMFPEAEKYHIDVSESINNLFKGDAFGLSRKLTVLLSLLTATGYHRAELDKEPFEVWDNDSEDQMVIYAYRWETDIEFKKRKAKKTNASMAAKKSARTRQANKVKKDKKKFENLKKKYGW